MENKNLIQHGDGELPKQNKPTSVVAWIVRSCLGHIFFIEIEGFLPLTLHQRLQ